MARIYQRKFLENGTPNPRFKPRPKHWKRQPKKYLPDGTLDPAWKPRSSGKHHRKFLDDGSLNPKWKPRKSSKSISNRSAESDKLVTLSQKLQDRESSYVMVDVLEQAAHVVNRITTSPLRRSALRLYQMILEIARERRQSIKIVSPTLIELAQNRVCPNCEKKLITTKLFCSELCQQEAITVRYCRRITRDDQRCQKHDIQEGIGIRLLMLLGGGYPAMARKLSPEVRTQILERDSHVCRICGDPATEIDHINSSSNDFDNLRAVCKHCNLELAINRAKIVTMESDPNLFLSIEQYVANLATRIASPKPLKICDDEINWMSIQYYLRAEQKNHRFLVPENLGNELSSEKN